MAIDLATDYINMNRGGTPGTPGSGAEGPAATGNVLQAAVKNPASADPATLVAYEGNIVWFGGNPYLWSGAAYSQVALLGKDEMLHLADMTLPGSGYVGDLANPPNSYVDGGPTPDVLMVKDDNLNRYVPVGTYTATQLAAIDSTAAGGTYPSAGAPATYLDDTVDPTVLKAWNLATTAYVDIGGASVSGTGATDTFTSTGGTVVNAGDNTNLDLDVSAEAVFDTVAAASAAEVAALTGADTVLVEIADGTLREVLISDLPVLPSGPYIGAPDFALGVTASAGVASVSAPALGATAYDNTKSYAFKATLTPDTLDGTSSLAAILTVGSTNVTYTAAADLAGVPAAYGTITLGSNDFIIGTQGEGTTGAVAIEFWET